MKATYNITDDKLKFWPDSRLSETEYASCKRAGFQWWPGRKCFAAKWSTQAEDFILGYGVEIEADDTVDDVEGRVERFQQRAEDAAQSAERSQQYLDEKANTERRKKNAVNSIERNLEAAAHWQRRIAGAISRANYREQPDVIARRIDGLERDERKFKKHLDRKQWSAPSDCYDEDSYRKWRDRKHELETQLNADKQAGNPWSQERKDEAIAELRPLRAKIFFEDKLEAAWKSHSEWAQRWLDHYQKRLEYERAVLAAAGGVVAMPGGAGHAPLDKGVFAKNGAVLVRDEWLLITKVNKRTVETFVPRCRHNHYRKMDRSEIVDVKSPDEVKAEMHYLLVGLAEFEAMFRAVHNDKAKMESKYMKELDEMCRPGKYMDQSEYYKQERREILYRSLHSEEVAA